MDEPKEPSVWYVAGVAICFLTVGMILIGLFGGGDSAVAIAAQ